MNFRKIKISGLKNEDKLPYINLDNVVMVLPIHIPTEMFGPDGKTPITKEGLGLRMVDGTIIPTELTEEGFENLIDYKYP